MKRTALPADESFWTLYILGRFVYLAEHATELGLHGAILDPEMYGADHWSYTGVCYCADCLREFCQDTGREVPAIAAAQRATWLKQNGLEQAFEQLPRGPHQGLLRAHRARGPCQEPRLPARHAAARLTGPFTRRAWRWVWARRSTRYWASPR